MKVLRDEYILQNAQKRKNSEKSEEKEIQAPKWKIHFSKNYLYIKGKFLTVIFLLTVVWIS